jgi:hypothetical protein
LLQEKEKKVEEEIEDLPTHYEIPLANLQPMLGLIPESKLKPNLTPKGTPWKRKRMAIILKAIIKPTKNEGSSQAKVALLSLKGDNGRSGEDIVAKKIENVTKKVDDSPKSSVALERVLVSIPYTLRDKSKNDEECDGTSQVIRPTYSCPCPKDLGQPCRCT